MSVITCVARTCTATNDWWNDVGWLWWMNDCGPQTPRSSSCVRPSTCSCATSIATVRSQDARSCTCTVLVQILVYEYCISAYMTEHSCITLQSRSIIWYLVCDFDSGVDHIVGERADRWGRHCGFWWQDVEASGELGVASPTENEARSLGLRQQRQGQGQGQVPSSFARDRSLWHLRRRAHRASARTLIRSRCTQLACRSRRRQLCPLTTTSTKALIHTRLPYSPLCECHVHCFTPIILYIFCYC